MSRGAGNCLGLAGLSANLPLVRYYYGQMKTLSGSEGPPGRRLLAVFAHPDDETLGTGGTLALYARRGVRVDLVCATLGEVGEAPPGLRGFATIGEMRENELRSATAVLGVSAVHLLGYRDSGMPGSADNNHPQALAAAPVEDVARRVAVLIRRLRPQVVITFDPIGGYRHPDHIAIHRAAVAAFTMAGDSAQELDGLAAYSPQKLYFSSFSRRVLRWTVRLMRLVGKDPRRVGANKDIDLASIVEVEFPISASIPIREVQHIKQRATALYVSQVGGIAILLRWVQRLIGGSESFMRAVPPPQPGHVERDLFEGL